VRHGRLRSKLILSMPKFFFSSRRRHTRWPRDWSSDVCSSDLADSALAHPWVGESGIRTTSGFLFLRSSLQAWLDPAARTGVDARSEERRVGKGCGGGRGPYG